MKILYLSSASGADYQCDMAFHGLRSLLGPDCVDVNKIHFMYQGTPHPPFFSIYGLLSEIDVDRSDIEAKIRARYFDAVVYGSIQRCQDHLPLVREVYLPAKIAFIDGEDDQVILHHLTGSGWYFKRELPDSAGHAVYPIQFAIPVEKIRDGFGVKSRIVAPLDPRDRSTYVYYGSEASYYDQYASSYFGLTMRKGGWDCARHYEIMAAGALPYFIGLESCPKGTLALLPKDSLLAARALADRWDKHPDVDEWQAIAHHVSERLRKYLTTETLARRILEALQCRI